MLSTKIKGRCYECFYIAQEPVVVNNEDGSETVVVDTYCKMCELFKRKDGYCDLWKPQDW